MFIHSYENIRAIHAAGGLQVEALFQGQTQGFVINEILDSAFIHIEKNNRNVGNGLALVDASHQDHGLQLLSRGVNGVGYRKFVLWSGRHILVCTARDERGLIFDEREVSVNRGAADGDDGRNDNGICTVLKVGVDYRKQIVLSVNGLTWTGTGVRSDTLSSTILGRAHWKQADAFADDDAVNSTLSISENGLKWPALRGTSLGGHVNGSTEFLGGE